MSQFFYYDANGAKQGPITNQQIRMLITQKIIVPETMIELENGIRRKAGSINGLFPPSSPVNAAPQPMQQQPPQQQPQQPYPQQQFPQQPSQQYPVNPSPQYVPVIDNTNNLEENSVEGKKAVKDFLKDYPAVFMFSYIVKLVQYFFTGIILLVGIIVTFYCFFFENIPGNNVFAVELIIRLLASVFTLIFTLLEAAFVFCFFGLLVDLALAIVRTEVNTRK